MIFFYNYNFRATRNLTHFDIISKAPIITYFLLISVFVTFLSEAPCICMISNYHLISSSALRCLWPEAIITHLISRAQRHNSSPRHMRKQCYRLRTLNDNWYPGDFLGAKKPRRNQLLLLLLLIFVVVLLGVRNKDTWEELS